MSRQTAVGLFLIMTMVLSFGLFACSDKKPAGPAPEYDVVIVGAGGGGLGAGARLALAGKKVLVIEQHDKVGGYMTAFERDDYRFEVSLHAFDGLDPGAPNHTVFKELGILDKIKPIRLDPMYRAYYPDFTLEVPADLDEYIKLLKQTFPHESDNIDKFLVTLSKIEKSFKAMFPFMLGDYGKGILGVATNFWRFPAFFKYMDASIQDLMDDHFEDQKLQAVICQLTGFLGASLDTIPGLVFATMWSNYHKDGYYYFEGGSQSVSDALAEVIEENGGKIILDTRVTKIVMKDGLAQAVQTNEGQEFTCSYVVSNADARQTFFKLIGKEHLPTKYMEDLEQMKAGITVFMVYLGLDHDYSTFFPKHVHEVILSVGYDTTETYSYMINGEFDKMPYAITIYSNVDPTAAPEGKTTLSITILSDYDYRDGWYEDVSYAKYDALKTEVAEAVIKRAEILMPGLSDHIEVIEIGSPRTMEHYTSNYRGAIVGWDFTPEQSMTNRLPQETPIDNLFLAGAWTFPGGGQSAVILSGLLAADKILKNE